MEELEVVNIMLPILLIVVAVAAGLLAISWAGITTLRMKWLRIDKSIQIGAFLFYFLRLLRGDMRTIGALIWQTVQTALI